MTTDGDFWGLMGTKNHQFESFICLTRIRIHLKQTHSSEYEDRKHLILVMHECVCVVILAYAEQNIKTELRSS